MKLFDGREAELLLIGDRVQLQEYDCTRKEIVIRRLGHFINDREAAFTALLLTRRQAADAGIQIVLPRIELALKYRFGDALRLLINLLKRILILLLKPPELVRFQQNIQLIKSQSFLLLQARLHFIMVNELKMLHINVLLLVLPLFPLQQFL